MVEAQTLTRFESLFFNFIPLLLLEYPLDELESNAQAVLRPLQLLYEEDGGLGVEQYFLYIQSVLQI